MKITLTPREVVCNPSPVWDLYELVGDEIKLRCSGGTCTDYILDGLMASFSGYNRGIIIYQGGSNLYNKQQYFCLHYSGKFSLTNLNHLEKSHRIKQTRVLHTEKDRYLIEVSRIWTKAPLLIHMFCWLLRLEQKFLNYPEFKGKFTQTFEEMFEYMLLPEFETVMFSKGHDFTIINKDTLSHVHKILENRQKIYLTEEDKPIVVEDIKNGMSHNGSGIKSYLSKCKDNNFKCGKLLTKHFEILNKGE